MPCIIYVVNIPISKSSREVAEVLRNFGSCRTVGGGYGTQACEYLVVMQLVRLTNFIGCVQTFTFSPSPSRRGYRRPSFLFRQIAQKSERSQERSRAAR